jgi:3-oxoacyl-[acyl-carrier-protein] synthase-1
MDVIATAMASSLGYDARTACAAARAGLVRRAELPFMLLEDDGSPGVAVGHPAVLLGGGFEGDGRLIRLLEGAFRDLMSQGPIEAYTNSRLALYLAIPPVDREHQGLNLVSDEARSDYLEQLGEAKPVDEFARAAKIVESAARLVNLPIKRQISPDTLCVSVSGQAAVVELYQRAQSDLDSGRADMAIVAGVDSLVTRTTLSWLHISNRLKGAESPAGLLPGEAAALIVLRNSRRNSTAVQPGHARIDHVARLGSPTQFLAGQPPDGKAQFEVLKSLRDISGASAERMWIVADQNGEVYRGNDWGFCLVRLQGSVGIDSGHIDVWYPAASFGDVGAASGAVATCMVTHAFERRYAPSHHAILLTSSDGVERSGCVVSAVEN